MRFRNARMGFTEVLKPFDVLRVLPVKNDILDTIYVMRNGTFTQPIADSSI